MGLTDAGFDYPTMAELIDEAMTSLKGLPNLGNMRVAPNSRAYNLYAPAMEQASKCWEALDALYQSLNRDSATGKSQDNLAGFIAKARKLQKRSTVPLTLYNQSRDTPVPIPLSSQAAQVGTGVLWETTEDAEIPALTTLHSGLDIDTITHIAGNEIEVVFNDTPDLSPVAVGDEITLSNSGNASNDGTFTITLVDAESYSLRYTNPERSDDTDDEASDSPAEADIEDKETSVIVAAQAIEYGPFIAAIGSITNINTPISGWDAVSNQSEANIGRLDEDNTDFRVRLAGETSSADGGTAAALKSKLLNPDLAPGVTYVTIAENRENVEVNGLKANSIHVTIVGGEHQTIIDLIGKYGPGGAATNGAESGVYTDSEGNPQDIFYSRVDSIAPYYIIELTLDPSIHEGEVLSAEDEATIKQSLANVSYQHGQDILNHRNVAAVSACGVDGLWTITVKQSLSPGPTLTSNLSIDSTEVVVVDLSRVSVVIL